MFRGNEIKCFKFIRERNLYISFQRFINHENKIASSKKLDYEDYKNYISFKSSLREPAITRQITSLAFQSGRNFISLAEGMPNETIFPFEHINIRMKDGHQIKLDGDKLRTALQYIPSQGLPSLLKSLKEFQMRFHNITFKDKDLIVTNGSQNGIYKCMELLVEYGDPVITQIPTYTGTLTILKPYNPEIIGITEDSEGMIPEQLDVTLMKRQRSGAKMPKVIYLIPTGLNPTGSVISNERRKLIYDIACKYDLLILEDDPYYFINFSNEIIQSFLHLDTEGRVIRFDSLSKVLSSGMRIGWVTAPKALIDIMELHMQASYLHSATLTQVIINELFNIWGYDGLIAHFDSVRTFYNEKKCMLEESLRKHLYDLAEWNTPKAGMFYWIKIKGIDDVYNMVIKKAIERGIMLVPGHAFMFDAKADCPYIRLTFSRADSSEMDAALSTLAHIIREERSRIGS